MSWTVDGHRYEDYSEYQAALARRAARTAGQQMETLSATVRDLEGRIERDHQAMQQAGNDLRRQREIGERMQANIHEMQRTNELLEETQRETERRMEDGFQQLESEVEAARGEIHGQQVDLQRLRNDHQKHVAEVQQSFEQTRAQLRAGLQQAEQRRLEMEKQLRAEIQKVDDKFEDDLRQRLAGARSQLDRSSEQLSVAEQIMLEHQGTVAALNLAEETLELREDIAQARRCVAQNDAASALALAGTALAKARTFSHRTMHRKVELAARQQIVQDEVARLRDRIAREKNPELVTYFERELAATEELLEKLSLRAKNGYASHRTLVTEEHENEKLLRQLESQVFRMTSSAPVVREMAIDRVDQVKKLIHHLESVYGPVRDGVSRFADEHDPKSPLLVECDFGGAKVNLHLDLEGGYRIDAFGHSSNSDCSSHGIRVAALLNEKTLVTGQEIEPTNRQTPRAQPEDTSSEWKDISAKLRNIKTQL